MVTMQQFVTPEVLINYTIMIFTVLTFAYTVFSDNSGKRE